MPKHLQLQIPASCGEDWNGMTPDGKGRCCASCRKTVVDFTAMSDAEIARYFERATSPTCGRFTASQLNRDLPLPGRTRPWVHSVFKYALPAFLLTLHTSGQVQQVRAEGGFITPVRPPSDKGDAVVPPVTIRGQITDEKGRGLPGASVMVRGTGRGTSTDTAGRFTLEVPSADAGLVISTVGYSNREVAASYFAGEGAALELMPLAQMMGEVVIVMGFAIPSRKEVDKRKELLLEERKKADTSIMAYPNPVQSGTELRLKCNRLQEGKYKAELFTPAGVLMRSDELTYVKKEGDAVLSTAGLPAGNYFLRLTHGRSGRSFSQEIVVAR